MALSDYENLVDDLVRDDASIVTSADRDDALALAVLRYSKDRPRILVEDVNGDGTKLMALPAGWVDDFSAIKSLEYPVGSVPPRLLENTAYELYQSPSAVQALFVSSITAGQPVRWTYTATHTLSGVADTIPAQDREAVCAWAAAILLDQLAARFSGDSDSTLGADSVDHGSKAGEYASRARALRKRYLDELGVDPKRTSAAGTVVDLDLNLGTGRDRLTHPGRLR